MTQEEIDETVAAIKEYGRKLIENPKEGMRVMIELGIIEDPEKTNNKEEKREGNDV